MSVEKLSKSLMAEVKEPITGRCRFYKPDGKCGVLGYRCKDNEDYARCGPWKDNVLGPVRHEEEKK